jgi:hypothetical protein
MEHYHQSSAISNLASDWHFGYIEKFQCYFNIWIYYYLHSNTRCCIFLNHAACQTVSIESRWCGTSKCLWGSNRVPQSSYHIAFYLKSTVLIEIYVYWTWRHNIMKRHQDEMSDSPSHKRQQTANDEEVPNPPNSLLSLPNEILQSCISFVGKGHYWFVGSIWNESTKSMQMKMKTWSSPFGVMLQ